MPVRFTEKNDRRVRGNRHAALQSGSITGGIREWHQLVGTKVFHLSELREYLVQKRLILMKTHECNVEQKMLMRLHKRGECVLDMQSTDARKQVYRFKG